LVRADVPSAFFDFSPDAFFPVAVFSRRFLLGGFLEVISVSAFVVCPDFWAAASFDAVSLSDAVFLRFSQPFSQPSFAFFSAFSQIFV
jgi:hypothetical protein